MNEQKQLSLFDSYEEEGEFLMTIADRGFRDAARTAALLLCCHYKDLMVSRKAINPIISLYKYKFTRMD